MPGRKVFLDQQGLALCCRCNEIKPKDEFYPDSSTKTGIRGYCKLCSVKVGNREHRKRKSGWTQKEYDDTLKAQDYRCRICKREKALEEREFAADHNHTTGQKRGILCSNCNVILGLAFDNPSILIAAAEYLEFYDSVAGSVVDGPS